MDKLSKWIFGEKYHRVLLLGEDSCGKTTFLRRLTFGEIGEHEPLPTRDFDIETTNYPATYKWSIWEFRIRCWPLIWRELAPHTLVLWLHDCSTEDDWPPWKFRSLLEQMVERGCRYIWVGLNKQDSPDVSEESVQEARRKYEEEFAKYKDDLSWKVLTHKLSAKTGVGVSEVLKDIYQAVKRANLEPPKEDKQDKTGTVISDSSDEKLTTEQLQRRIEKEVTGDTIDPDAFWTSFLEGDLPAWTHYTYLKALYFVILESAKKKTFTEIANDFNIHLIRLRNISPQLFNDSETPSAYVHAPFNICLATFWTLQLQHGIREYRMYSMSSHLPSREEFPQVLRRSPSLMSTYLWKSYYSFNPVSRPRDYWSIPNLRKLPTQTDYLRDPATVPRKDEGPDKLIRYAFAVMQYVRNAGAARGQVVTQALVALQQATMRARTADSTVETYSETQAYFWIQIVHAALRSLDDKKGSVDTSEMSFEAFQQTFHLKPTDWQEYYSKKLWNSVAARSQFVMPDLKPLPNVIASLPSKVIRKAPEGIPKLPSAEELTFRARMACEELTPTLQSSGPPVLSHTHLLFYLHKRFTQSAEGGTRKKLERRARELFSEIAGPIVAGATYRNFWIQQVGVAVLNSDIGKGRSTFPEFITSNLHLVFEELHGIYYGPGVWTSADAAEKILGPDRRRMETIVNMADVNMSANTK
ncbi:hypothetical protein KXV68_006714 [Aspergillus fumigatus]|nr:hypothetical protein KXX66_006744 [Aspergillus fumigatus]KAH1337838.1 hypothetical protein KXX67_001137 [Aspergillus fumigatus]KAH1366480.1 hypothetical protein KXX63_002959 [Aspergillus fumigatus]KAH1445616.1 hypothetical protein KXX68_007008 [Aspergillus fumigatus]KAH1483097.1 hypothetical protein KXX26_006161 [Aspergillus fumigatus]